MDSDEFASEHKNGRFLKKDGPLYSICTITEYSFEEICTYNSAFPDNMRRNILHVRLHDEERLENALKGPVTISETFEDGHMNTRVIMPRDFTPDWLEEKRKARRRSSTRFADEDEFEMALEEEAAKEDDEPGASPSAAEVKPDGAEPSPNGQVESAAGAPPPTEEITEGGRKDDSLRQLQSPQLDTETPLAIVGDAIKDFASEGAIPPDHMGTVPPIEPPTPEPQESSPAVNPSQTEATNDPGAGSFEEGYDQGISAGRREAKQEIGEKLSILDQISEEMSSKRREILSRAQSQFEQVVSAISEAIVGKELRKDKTALLGIISNAVEESIKDDEFKVFVSQEVLDSVADQTEHDIIGRMEVDPELSGVNFRVESDQTSVESNLHGIVEDLLAKADVSLFEEDDS